MFISIYIYNNSIAYSESIKVSKTERKTYEFYTSVRFLKQILLISLDLYKYKTDDNMNYNVFIQDYIITKDFTKIIKAMFIFYNENYHPKRLLLECIELTEVVYIYI